MRTIGGEKFLNPEQLLIDVGVTQGMRIADLGSGSGYATFPAAKMVGKYGMVYAVDIQKEALNQITGQAKLLGLENIRTVWSDIEKLGAANIEPNSIDIALLVNVLFFTDRYDYMLKEAARLTKTGGKIVVVDWKNAGTPFGPPVDQRVDFERVDHISKELGFVKVDSFNVGKYHYGIVYKK